MAIKWPNPVREEVDNAYKKWVRYCENDFETVKDFYKKENWMKNGCYPSTRYNNTKDTYSLTQDDITICVKGRHYNTHGVELISDCDGSTITATARTNPPDLAPLSKLTSTPNPNTIEIVDVIFNPPATIVFWSDNTKTVVKCNSECDMYDPEKGIAMAIAKKFLGNNKSNYYNSFKPWLEKYDTYDHCPVELKYEFGKDLRDFFDELLNGL